MIFKTEIKMRIFCMDWTAVISHTCIDDDIEIKSVILTMNTGRMIHEYAIDADRFEDIKKEHYFTLLDSARNKIMQMADIEYQYPECGEI